MPPHVALVVPPGHTDVLVPFVDAVVLLVEDAVVVPHVVTVDSALMLVTVPLVSVGKP